MNIAITSPCAKDYNCIAWAAEDDTRWWQPSFNGLSYWPTNTFGDYSLENYISAYATIGYERCDSEYFEEGFQKVALYIDRVNEVTHAARLLDNGFWTSKLGQAYDIQHPFIRVWENISYEGETWRTADYGKLAAILRRRIP